LTTKIHIAVDGLGNPLRIILSPGQDHDSTRAEDLIAGLSAQHIIADKAYDIDKFRAALAGNDIIAVIPPKANRVAPIQCDWTIYKERHLVECFFCKIKQFRRIATRYDKTAVAFFAFVSLACLMVWLR
jgi:transposase